MQVHNLRPALLAAILALAFLGLGLAGGTGNAQGLGAHRAYSAPVRGYRTGGLQGKIQYCEDCHGPSGQGYRGYLPIPRLAGQPPQYLENELQAFGEGRGEGHRSLSLSNVHRLNPQMRAALAAYFSHLNPRPFGGAPRGLVDMGKTIYEGGVPDDNVPACSVCHGPGAKGHEGIPRLAGQLYPYIIMELEDWDRERGEAGPGTPLVMRPIAHDLNRHQIEAVAAYLSYLE
jgi:cytochrome c553